MNKSSDVWSFLRNLESQDTTFRLHKEIMGRSLSKIRVKEINSAARQSREYFLNSTNADLTV